MSTISPSLPVKQPEPRLPQRLEAVETQNPATQPVQPALNSGAESKVGESNLSSVAVRDRVQSFDGTGPRALGFTNEATVTRSGGQVIVDAGDGDDQIGISQDDRSGDVTVTVNGEAQTFSGADSENLVIRAGEGNDNIWVGNNVRVNLRLEGESGDDFIRGGQGNDKIEGGVGNDRLHGNGGADYINGSKGEDIIYGDDGNDVVYGGDDNDKIYGAAGNDYLEGSKGSDEIYGCDGDDVLSGGVGDDYLRGGYGNETIYAGSGSDEIYGDDGTNSIYSQTGDKVQDTDANGVSNKVVTVELAGNPGTSVVVNGSDEFVERVQADLEMLRSSPTGRQMLEGFYQANRDDGVTVTINGFSENNGTADWDNRLRPTLPQPFYDPATGTRGTPNNSTIHYNPSFTPAFENADGSVTEEVPSAILFHEMAHAWDMTHGTLRNQRYTGNDGTDTGIMTGERVAVGLPIDHDGDPRTPERTDNAVHPDALTENALRIEMGMGTRDHYRIRSMLRV